MKAIPGADKKLIDYAAELVDRMSLNIELPSENSLKLLAPQKTKLAIVEPMKMLADIYIQDKQEKPKQRKIPAGQTTQMIIGASPDTDGMIVRLSEALYRNYELKRVYYSAYVPVNLDNSLLPVIPPDLRREHRLYEADWLMRFYGYKANELLPNDYNLALDIDVKSDWAVNNYKYFPVEINTAPYEILVRVPGIGVKNAYRIVHSRCHGKLDWDSLKRMRVVLKRAKHFITIDGKFYGETDNPFNIRNILNGSQLQLNAPNNEYVQLSLLEDKKSIITGEF